MTTGLSSRSYATIRMAVGQPDLKTLYSPTMGPAKIIERHHQEALRSILTTLLLVPVLLLTACVLTFVGVWAFGLMIYTATIKIAVPILSQAQRRDG